MEPSRPLLYFKDGDDAIGLQDVWDSRERDGLLRKQRQRLRDLARQEARMWGGLPTVEAADYRVFQCGAIARRGAGGEAADGGAHVPSEPVWDEDWQVQ